MPHIFQLTSRFLPCVGEGGGGGGTPDNGLFGEVPPERGTFFNLKVYERVGILLVEVYERCGKSVICFCERSKRANRFIKSRKCSIFVINSYLNDSAFTAVKRMQSSKQGI